MSRVEKYKRCAAEGLTAPQTAKVLGVSTASVYDARDRHGITFVRGRARKPTVEDVTPRKCFSCSPAAIRRFEARART